MHRSRFAILLVGWSFVGLPVLCEAGELAHACECAPDAQCGHEDDCHDDPCAGIMASQPPRVRHEFAVTSLPLIAHQDFVNGPEVVSVTLAVFDVPIAATLPFPESDVPLRI